MIKKRLALRVFAMKKRVRLGVSVDPSVSIRHHIAKFQEAPDKPVILKVRVFPFFFMYHGH